MTPTIEDRYEGCLLGLAVGDALGSPLEFMGSEQIRIKHGWVSDMIGGGWLGLRPGETTDESALVLALGASLTEKGGVDVDDVAARYREWFRTAPNDVEPTTKAALEALEEGHGPADAASRAKELTTDQAASSGTLVRAVPIALLLRADPRRMLDAVAREAALTHADSRSVGGAVAVAAVLAQILGGERDRAAIVDAAHDELDRIATDLPNVLPDPVTKDESALRPTRFVVDALETALVRWFRDPDLETCLTKTVNLGGCSGTTGALAGALAGATWGSAAIPRRWARNVQDRSSFVRLARALLDRSGGDGVRPGGPQ
jgi:ADP-ribosyl-[dinitrogen reductase] hydrolase